ncbi:MAG TPA: sigma-70 family RNA polymerase sigma factor [Gemmataceae bacterium]|nr:sigma-70 family RNA polymerase sigma factor [Gemmataceae bacterium]
MPNAPLHDLLDRFRGSPRLQETDGQLLGRYVKAGDELAFELLVRRHGPMVMGVCRRLLLTPEDAEDAFQATFLVLARKATSVRPRERVGPWLHGVASLAARKLRAATTRRWAREKQVRVFPEPATVADGLWTDLAPLLDREVSHLPEKYRLPVVLCDLEGKTRAEAARQLGWPEGTVAGRLVRGRALLAKRLTRLGLPVSAGVLTAVLSQNASARVPLTLVEQAAKRTASGPVVALAEGVLKAMLLTKSKLAATFILALAVLVGASVLAGGGSSVMPKEEPAKVAEPAAKQDAEPAAPKKEEAEEVAWGEAVDGVRAGLVFPAEGRLSCRVGEKVGFAVKVRNVGKGPAKVSYYSGVMKETPAAVEDAAGKAVPVAMPLQKLYKRRLTIRTLEAGETFDLGTQELAVAADGKDGEVEGATLVAEPGWYRVSYHGVARTRDSGKDPGLLSTGQVSLMVAEKVSADAAWGKAVGGLQAGIAFRKGRRRPYRLREVVTLVAWVRNVSGKPLTFDYTDGYMVETPPTVKDADGHPATLSEFPILAGIWRPLHATLKPGEEFEMGSLRLALEEAGGKDAGKPSGPTLYASPGKYRVNYEGLPSGLSDAAKFLSTGEIELEVKAKGDLEGTWKATSFEQDGRVLPEEKVKEIEATFGGDGYRFTSGLRVAGALTGTFTADAEAKPKSFDLVPKAGVFKGQSFKGIYKVDGDTLTLCFVWPTKERPKEFVSPPNSSAVLAVFKRQKP